MMANQADIRNLSSDKVTSVLCSSFSPITFPFFIYIITLRLGLLEKITLRAFKIPVHQRKHQACSLGRTYGREKVEADISERYWTRVFRIKLSYLESSIHQNNSFHERSWTLWLVSYAALLPPKALRQMFVELDGTLQTLSSPSLGLGKDEERSPAKAL